MNRQRRTPAAVLGLALLLGVTGCSDDEPEPGSTTASSPSTAPTAAYAVTLELVEEEEPPSPPSDAPAMETPTAAPEPGAPMVVEVTNTGKKKDAYLLRLLPPGAGGVAPESLELAAGESVVVRVSVAGLAPDETLSLVAVSRARGEELAELELPGPPPAP